MKKTLEVLVVTVTLLWCSSASAECLVKPIKNNDGAEFSFRITVPPEEEKNYQARGFVSEQCSQFDVAAFNRNMCQLARRGNRAVQNRLEQVLGVSPSKMCEMSKSLANVR